MSGDENTQYICVAQMNVEKQNEIFEVPFFVRQKDFILYSEYLLMALKQDCVIGSAEIKEAE